MSKLVVDEKLVGAFLAIYFVASISSFFFTVGFYRYLILALILSTSISIFLSASKDRAWLSVLAISLLLLSYVVFNAIFFGIKIHLTVLSNILAPLFVAFSIKNNPKCLSILYNLFFVFVVCLSLLLLTGFDAENIFAGSRNTVSMILVCVGSVFLIINYSKGRAFDLILYFLILLCCVLSIGRSGILTSAILFSAAIYRHFRPSSNSNVVKLFLIGSAGLFFVYIFAENTSYFYYLNTKGLSDGYRGTMLHEYIGSMSLRNILFGVELSTLPYISSFNLNPHNTYLYLHSYYGFLALIFYVCVSFWLLRLLLLWDMASALALLAAMLRLGTDSGADITVFPLMFVLSMFITTLRWGKTNMTTIKG